MTALDRVPRWATYSMCPAELRGWSALLSRGGAWLLARNIRATRRTDKWWYGFSDSCLVVFEPRNVFRLTRAQ